MRLKGDEYVSKTIEKMLILLLQISKFRLRRPRRWLPEVGSDQDCQNLNCGTAPDKSSPLLLLRADRRARRELVRLVFKHVTIFFILRLWL